MAGPIVKLFRHKTIKNQLLYLVTFSHTFSHYSIACCDLPQNTSFGVLKLKQSLLISSTFVLLNMYMSLNYFKIIFGLDLSFDYLLLTFNLHSQVISKQTSAVLFNKIMNWNLFKEILIYINWNTNISFETEDYVAEGV